MCKFLLSTTSSSRMDCNVHQPDALHLSQIPYHSRSMATREYYGTDGWQWICRSRMLRTLLCRCTLLPTAQLYDTKYSYCFLIRYGPGSVPRSRYSDWLRAGRSGDRIPVGARFSAPVQTGTGTHPASCTMGNESFPRVKSGRGVTLT